MEKSKQETHPNAARDAKELRRAGARIHRLGLRLARIADKISQHTAVGNKEKVAQFEEEQERREAEIKYLATKYPKLKAKA